MNGWPPYSLGSQAGVVVTNHSISTWLEGFSQFSGMGTSNKGVILQTNIYSVWEDFYVKMWDYAFLNDILGNGSFFLRLTGENLLKSSWTNCKLTLLFQADRFIMGEVVASVSNTALSFWRLEVLEIIGKIFPMRTAGPCHWSLCLLPDYWLFSIYSFITICCHLIARIMCFFTHYCLSPKILNIIAVIRTHRFLLSLYLNRSWKLSHPHFGIHWPPPAEVFSSRVLFSTYLHLRGMR